MKYFKLELTDELHKEIKLKAIDAGKSMHAYVLDKVKDHEITMSPKLQEMMYGDAYIKQPTKEPCAQTDCKQERWVKGKCQTHQVEEFYQAKEPTTATGVLIKYGSEMTRKPTKVLPGGVVTIEELKKPKKKPKCPHADDLVDICANCIKKR